MEIQQKKSSFQEIISHQHFTHFLLYCLTYVGLGQVLSCLGPMFPYLSAHQNRLETQYSFLFVCRAIGYLLGSLLMKVFMGKFTLHQFIAIGILAMGGFGILFDFVQNLYLKGFLILVSTLGCSIQDVIINMAAIECFKGENLSSWIQTIHGAFAIGGLIGPFIVYMFQLRSLTILGIYSLIIAVFYYRLETPQNMPKDKKQDQQEIVKHLPSMSIYLISIGFLLAVGQQISYGGWISSYAVLENFSTKQHATFYSSLYWIAITISRFLLASVQGKPSKKIIISASVGIFTTFISYFLIFKVNSELGLIAMSIFYGFCNSTMFPLLFVIPEQFGYKLTVKESSTFIIWASFGQGCLAVGVGKMMQYYSNNWLLYSVCLFNIVIVIVVTMNTKHLEEINDTLQKDEKIQNLLLNQKNNYRNVPTNQIFQMKQIKK